MHLLRWLRRHLPKYAHRPPEPVSVGVMAPPPPVPGWTSRRYRKAQARYDQTFWGLIHDHNWLQYEPRKEPPE